MKQWNVKVQRNSKQNVWCHSILNFLEIWTRGIWPFYWTLKIWPIRKDADSHFFGGDSDQSVAGVLKTCFQTEAVEASPSWNGIFCYLILNWPTRAQDVQFADGKLLHLWFKKNLDRWSNFPTEDRIIESLFLQGQIWGLFDSINRLSSSQILNWVSIFALFKRLQERSYFYGFLVLVEFRWLPFHFHWLIFCQVNVNVWKRPKTVAAFIREPDKKRTSQFLTLNGHGSLRF